MKTVKRGFIIIYSLFLVACNNASNLELPPNAKEEDMHWEHSPPIDNLAHKGIIVLDQPFRVPKEFGYLMESVFGSYMGIGEAMANGDTVAANKAAETMEFLLGFANNPSEEDRVANAWMSHKESYLKNLKEFQLTKSIKEKRIYFSHISEALYCTFKSFDMEVGDIHVSYCPMVLENQGAYWLTNGHSTGNPYFREDVLKCLEKTEIIP